jgi:hypothetical protein
VFAFVRCCDGSTKIENKSVSLEAIEKKLEFIRAFPTRHLFAFLNALRFSVLAACSPACRTFVVKFAALERATIPLANDQIDPLQNFADAGFVHILNWAAVAIALDRSERAFLAVLAGFDQVRLVVSFCRVPGWCDGMRPTILIFKVQVPITVQTSTRTNAQITM